jgi:hypothetical protein
MVIAASRASGSGYHFCIFHMSSIPAGHAIHVFLQGTFPYHNAIECMPRYIQPSTYYILLSASLSHAFARSFASPCLKILKRSSPFVDAEIPCRQSQPRLIFPFTMTPLLPIECFSCDANMELPIIEKLLEPLEFDVVFLSI